MTSGVRGRLLTGSCGVCAAWMVMMSTRFFALSLPDIEGALGIGPDEGSWLTAGYLAFEPVGVGLGCWLAVIFSLRRIMLPAIMLFATSSAIAAMTHDLTLMILARSGMGLAAGLIIPLAIITELRTFPPTWRALAIGLYASAATMAPQAAASLDVWLVEHWGTPAIFDAARLQRDAAWLGYRQAVLNALRDVEDRLATIGDTESRLSSVGLELHAAQEKLLHVQRQYRDGEVDLAPYLVQGITSDRIHDQGLTTQQETVLASIALYKALGGGWRPVLSGGSG